MARLLERVSRALFIATPPVCFDFITLLIILIENMRQVLLRLDIADAAATVKREIGDARLENTAPTYLVTD